MTRFNIVRASATKRAAFVSVCIVAFFADQAAAQAKQSATGTIVASNMNAASVSIVDVASGTTLATIPTGVGPHEVAVSNSGKHAVIAIYGDKNSIGSSMLVVDIANPTATRTIELGSGNQRPHGVQFTPDDRTLIITGERAQRLLFVDFESGKIDSSLSTGQPVTHMVATSKDGKHAFTTNITGMSVSAVDVAGRKLRGTFPVGQRIEGLGVTPDGKEVWVGGNESHQVYVLNGESGKIEHTLAGFGMAYRVGITPDGRTAVISDPGSEKIHIYDVATHKSRAVIDVPLMDGGMPSSPQGITMSRDNKTAYVTLKNAAKVAIVDLGTQKITGTLPVGAGSDGVGYTPMVFKK
jgi:DNA-binding beta-propeller fold protein YncE